PVLTLEYGWLPIGQIVRAQLDCQVFSVDSQGHLYTQPIAQWHHRGQQELFEYILEDGSVIQATPDHQFMTIEGQMRPIQTIFEQGYGLYQVSKQAWQGAQEQSLLAGNPASFDPVLTRLS
ncbi:MAG: hypothetical protein HC792_04335, partial [Acaryochloridaceae cyanobacterium CSU_5_19]|nr:hypothetical protein [Acaryochloridaceae cyanobacterium CSU_5_19]